MTKSRVRKSVLIWFILSPLLILNLFPFVVMFLTAIKPATEVFHRTWFPTQVEWINFFTMWAATNFGKALWNSLYISTLTTLITLSVSLFAGYALSRLRFPGRAFFNRFLLISQMLSPIVLILGLFQILAFFKVLNDVNIVAVIYAGFNVAFSVWMLESYFGTIPKDLEQAAWIDGATPLQSFFKIFLPLTIPALAGTATFTFVNAWNEYVIALSMLRRQETLTLPIEIYKMVAGRYAVEWHFVMAGALLATVPVAILFAWMQKYMTQGLTAGAVK